MCAEHVYAWWFELNARRGPGFDSLAPLTYTEVVHWLFLTRRHVAPHEIRWLMTMDDKWIATVAEERQAKQERDREEAERTKPRKR